MSTTNSNPAADSQPSKGRAVGTIVTISLLIISLALLAGWFLFLRGGNDTDEREAYNTIMQYENERKYDIMEEALSSYFDTYNADAYHFSQLKELYDRFTSESADWKGAEAEMTYAAIQHFLDVHPDGFYREDGHRKLDSLSYLRAVEADTREAYEHYISQFARGRYVKEANAKLAELDNVELSVEEKQDATDAVQTHFDGLAQNDRGAVSATLASNISSYIGKANPEEEDIYAYMANMHATGRFLVFVVKDAVVEKVDVAGRNMYNVQFVLDEETYASSPNSTPVLDTEAGDAEAEERPKPTSVKHFKGTAVLNERMKITSLVLRQ
ncbi:MAG: hypothetical protein IJP82_05245 [Bacteroidaceae bacterium]|nr:hypothetical protein [Bacteroidaceae bacterium]